jgi:hypothetical protein
MLIVIYQQFEDNLKHGEKILICLETFQFGGIPRTENICVDAPDNVVE